MKNLVGSAEVEYLGKSAPCDLLINMETGRLEVTAGRDISDNPEMQPWALLLQADVKLRSLRIETPGGELSLDEYGNCFLLQHLPGETSPYESTTQLCTEIAGDRIGLTRMHLQPRTTRIDFNFRAAYPSNQNELTLEMSGFSRPAPIRLEVGGSEATGIPLERFLVLKGGECLNTHAEQISLAVGIAQGGPVTIRSTITGTRFSLNIAPHEHSSVDSLCADASGNAELVQRLITFFSNQQGLDYTRFRRAAYFYLHGVGGRSPLDARIVNLYTALEMVDDASEMNKRSVSSTLDITPDDADLICRVRNEIVHHGLSIHEAVIRRLAEIKTHRPRFRFKAFDLSEHEPKKGDAAFFFGLATLLGRYWARKVGFEGELFPYTMYS